MLLVHKDAERSTQRYAQRILNWHMRVIKSFWLNLEEPHILRLPAGAEVVYFGYHFRPKVWVLMDADIPESAYLERTFIVIADDLPNRQTLIPAGTQHVKTFEPTPANVLHLFEFVEKPP
jgi:hypothetical protein